MYIYIYLRFDYHFAILPRKKIVGRLEQRRIVALVRHRHQLTFDNSGGRLAIEQRSAGLPFQFQHFEATRAEKFEILL